MLVSFRRVSSEQNPAAEEGDSRKKKSNSPKTPKNAEKPVRRHIPNYDYKLSIPFYYGDDDKEIIRLAYVDLPSHCENASGICHNLIIRKVSYMFVPCTFKSRNDGEYNWPLVPNKAQPPSAIRPAKPKLISPPTCRDCTLNQQPNMRVGLNYLEINGAVGQSKLDDKHTLILLLHASNRFYPFCMEFTYLPSTFVQVSVDGCDYPCCGAPASTRVKPEDRVHALSITVNYHNKTYVVEHPNFHFENRVALVIESKVYKLELSDLNMRTLPSPSTITGECYFKTIRDSSGSSAYFFMKKGSDRELIQIAQKTEAIFDQEEWSESDSFKAQVTSLSWVLSEAKVDLEQENLRFGVSGTVVIQSDDIHRTHRLFKTFLMSRQRAYVLEKVMKLRVLCSSL